MGACPSRKIWNLKYYVNDSGNKLLLLFFFIGGGGEGGGGASFRLKFVAHQPATQSSLRTTYSLSFVSVAPCYC